MVTSYFTFGQDHRYVIDGKVFDKDCVVQIEAETHGEARKKMFEVFGEAWSFQYANKPPKMEYFPRGIIKLFEEKS